MRKPTELMKKRINDQLYWDTRVDASKITVSVENDVVELSGFTPNLFSKKRAEEVVKHIEGVKNIKNHIKVKFPAVPLFPKIEDSEIQSNAIIALELNVSINAKDIDIIVKNGIVTLEGHVDVYWKKDIAENVISDINGVIDVINKIVIIPKESIIDRKIAYDIILAIERYNKLNIDDITVKVEDANVQISGNVRNWDAYGLAIDAVRYTEEVINIEDNLVIKNMV